MNRERYITYLCGAGNMLNDNDKTIPDEHKILTTQMFIDNVLTAIHLTPCSIAEKEMVREILEDSDIILLAKNREWRRAIKNQC